MRIPTRNVRVGQDNVVEAQVDRIRGRVGLILAPSIFIALLLIPMPGLSDAAHRLAAVFAAVVILWVTETIPLAVTALLGPAVAVIMGVGPVDEVFAPFAHPLIFLFMGSFILSRAIFLHRLNERIVLAVLSWKLIGAHPTRIMLAYLAVGALVSGWMSNTATAAMLLPIGLSLLAFMESEASLNPNFGTVFLLATAYVCSLGGLMTVVGTAPNVIAVGMLDQYLDVRLSFIDWMMFAVPISLILLILLFFYLHWIGGPGIREIPGADRIISERKAALGSWSRGEKNVLIAFGTTVLLWVLPGILTMVLNADNPVSMWFASAIPNSVAVMIGVGLLFVLPLSETKRSTITWKQASEIDWGTILLFGGGLALGQLTFKTGLAGALAEGFTGLFPISSVVSLTFVSAAFLIFFTEIMSNTAAINIMGPIIISIAQASGVDPIPPLIAASLSASVAVMLPVATPPNAIVYSSGRIPITKMVRYGFVVDIVASILVPSLVLLLFLW